MNPSSRLSRSAALLAAATVVAGTAPGTLTVTWSAPHLRDVGGYRTTDGQWVRMGAVYRSQALSLSTADLAADYDLRTTADYDLRTTADYDRRTTAEIAQSPDVVPAGATYTNLDVMADISLTPTLTSPAAAEGYMQEIEQDFVTDATARAEATVYAPLLEVQASYLQAGLAQVTASYGSMYDYAVHGLGLSPQTIAKLRAKLLVG
jgi:Tyrosine phosphatase family